MYLLFRRFLAKVPFLHFDPINAFELPDWFQVKAFVPDLLCFLFGHCVNGINDLPALVVLSFIKQLRFRDFSGLCENRSKIPAPEFSVSKRTMYR